MCESFDFSVPKAELAIPHGSSSHMVKLKNWFDVCCLQIAVVVVGCSGIVNLTFLRLDIVFLFMSRCIFSQSSL